MPSACHILIYVQALRNNTFTIEFSVAFGPSNVQPIRVIKVDHKDRAFSALSNIGLQPDPKQRICRRRTLSFVHSRTSSSCLTLQSPWPYHLPSSHPPYLPHLDVVAYTGLHPNINPGSHPTPGIPSCLYLAAFCFNMRSLRAR